jgi:hypothetical protein
MATEYKIISTAKEAEIKLKDADKIMDHIEDALNFHLKNGWEVVGTGPERNVLLKGGFLVEMLRSIPIVNILINWLFPLQSSTSISII